MSRSTPPPGILISAPASGTGKTTLTLALARALRDRGLAVQCFKCGPDYIDPAFHRAASGRSSFNLDSWAMSRETIFAITAHAVGADIIIAEGAMGLFDGVAAPGCSGTGASADIAQLMGWPVVVVLDPAGQAQTSAAVAKGLMDFRTGVPVAGVVLNRVASPRHESLVRAGMKAAGIRVLGCLPRHAAITLPERHLGLVQAEEHADLEDTITEAAKLVADYIDLDHLLAIAACAPVAEPAVMGEKVSPPGQRIALARDAAFTFIYPHILDSWRVAGAEILPFSPLADEGPHPSADVCWLSGGYPELHAGHLASHLSFRTAMLTFAQTRPVHGECGGYMVMGTGLIDGQGNRHAMLGLLGLETSFATRRMHLGYRVAKLKSPMPGLMAGATLRGHEFHYATILQQSDDALACVRDANGQMVDETGSCRGNATGTFFHMIAEGA